jgi:hypothetical protein
MKMMSFGTDRVRLPLGSPIEMPGSMGATLALEKAKGATCYDNVCTHTPPVGKSMEQDATEEQEAAGDLSLEDNPP